MMGQPRRKATSMADSVTRFETAFADWLGADRAFAFWKGRVAMYAILKALGVGGGDEVILPGYTCVVAVNPIKFLGTTPVYVDIEPATYNINPACIEAKISPRTRAIVAQHTYGYPAEMDRILAIAEKHGLPVIEDACLAVGSTYKGRKAGTLGRAAFWSFQWNKTFTTGIGGMVTTSDADLADRLARLQTEETCRPGFKENVMLTLQRGVRKAILFPKTFMLLQSAFRWMVDHGLALGSSATREYRQAQDPDFFKVMGAGQGRAGAREVRRLEANLAHRRQMADLYASLLDDAGWPRPPLPDHIDPVLVRYPVRVADKAAALALAAERRVELGDWFESPLHQALASLDQYDYHEGTCPNAEQAAREVVNLPMHRRVRERHARQAVDLIREIGPAR